MKKYISLCISIILAAACAKSPVGRDVRISASISVEPETDATKVSYTEYAGTSSVQLDLRWEVGDKIIGYCGDNTFEYTVASIEQGEAQLQWCQGYQLAGTESDVHMFYAPGVDYASAKSFSINYAQQDINDPLPCLLSATGSFVNGAINMKFHPQAAILAIRGIDGFQPNEKINSIRITGTAVSPITVINGDTGWTATGLGIMADTVKAVLPVGSSICTVSVNVVTEGASNGKRVIQFERTITAGTYYYTVLDMTKKKVGVQIGGEISFHSSIGDAFAAANNASSDAVITLLNNASSNTALNVNNTSGNKVTLDLNGRTLSSKITVQTDFDIKDSGDGGIIQAGENTVKIDSVSATLSICGGKIIANTGNYAINAYGSTQDSQLRPTINISKCVLTSNAESGSAISSRFSTFNFNSSNNSDILVTGSNRAIFSSTSATINIHGGTFSGKTAAVYFGASSVNLTINGGILKSDEDFFTYYKKSNPTVSINGGYFSWGQSFATTTTSNLKISGGYFTDSVSDYLKSGSHQYSGSWYNDGIEYNYKVE